MAWRGVQSISVQAITRRLRAPHGRVVIATAADFVEAIALVQAVGGLVAGTHFQEAFASLQLAGAVHQVLQQAQAQAAALAFRLDGDVQQVGFADYDVDHAMADLLAAFEHQPAIVGFEAVSEDASRPGVAEGGVFDFQHGIEIRLGHRAKGNGIGHSVCFQRRITRRMACQSSPLRSGSSINSSRPGRAQAAPRPST